MGHVRHLAWLSLSGPPHYAVVYARAGEGTMKSPRYWTVVLFMVVTLALLLHRGDADHVPPSQPLSQMPSTIDGKIAEDVPLQDDVLAVLGKGDFLNRLYSSPKMQQVAST